MYRCGRLGKHRHVRSAPLCAFGFSIPLPCLLSPELLLFTGSHFWISPSFSLCFLSFCSAACLSPRRRYYIEIARLPSFLSLPLGLEILRIGKSLNFLKKICGSSDHVSDSSFLSASSPRSNCLSPPPSDNNRPSKALLLRDFSSFSGAASRYTASKTDRRISTRREGASRKSLSVALNEEDEDLLCQLPPNVVQELNLHLEERRLRLNFLKGSAEASSSVKPKKNSTTGSSVGMGSSTYGYILAQRDDKKTRKKSYGHHAYSSSSFKDFFFPNHYHDEGGFFDSPASLPCLHCTDDELPWLEELQKRVRISSNIKNKLYVHLLPGGRLTRSHIQPHS